MNVQLSQEVLKEAKYRTVLFISSELWLTCLEKSCSYIYVSALLLLFSRSFRIEKFTKPKRCSLDGVHGFHTGSVWISYINAKKKKT